MTYITRPRSLVFWFRNHLKVFTIYGVAATMVMLCDQANLNKLSFRWVQEVDSRTDNGPKELNTTDAGAK